MPEAPKKDGYTVTWEKLLDTVTGDVTAKAVYTEIPANDPSDSPQNGDNSQLWLLWLLMIASATAIATLAISRKSKIR